MYISSISVSKKYLSMASKSSLLVLAMVLFHVSSILTIKARDLSKHSHDEFKFEPGALLTGGPKSNTSAGKTTSSPMKAGSDHYTHIAGFQSKGEKGNTWWHGVRAKINVWKIQGAQPLSESSAYIAAINNLNGNEIVMAGVHVYPQMYNNSDLRFFTYWRTTRDDDSRGCFNDHCPGFVIANNSNLFPGQALSPLSNYEGGKRYITLRIKKDQKTGDWSLYREDQGGPIGGMTLLGWWPQSLFKNLSDRANIIQWSGEVSYQYNEMGPSMGSGHFVNMRDPKEVASFDDCYGFDYDGTVYEDDCNTIPLLDRPDCYNISHWYQPPIYEGYSQFYYGGPGGCSK